MILLKQLIHDTKTNSVEATWVEVITLPQREISPGIFDTVRRTQEVQVRCHSYAAVQMDMLEADLGADLPSHAALIATVRAGIVVPTAADLDAHAALIVATRAEEIKTELKAIDMRKIRPMSEGDTAYLAALNANAQLLRAELVALLNPA
jgi:hypothetical protein